ncbi:MAG: hypothetical protein NZ519_03115 [Bacteroidia bacterium]|nr:hypothetical protein [Bacteroidia bacterium]MDW8300880.1 hypothetical protein [Bacteroidia bacterium]
MILKIAIYLFLAIFAFFCLISPSFAQTKFAHAGEYITYMTNQQREILKNHMAYTSAVAHQKSAKKIEQKRKDLINSNLQAQKNIANLPPYNNDIALRDSTVAFLKLAYLILIEDYAKIINLEEVAEQSYDAMEAYLLAQDLAAEKLKQANDRLQNQVKVFAAKNNVRLVEAEKDDLSKKIEISNKVAAYYREVFLLFFKCSNQERYLIEAINRRDLSAFSQSQSVLSKYTTENLAKLAQVKPFNGDNTLVEACRKALLFYQKECKEYAPLVQNYWLKQDDFEKVKKNLEAKGNQTNQEDVNQYNKMVNEINTITKQYNDSSNTMNKQRTEIINAWNTASNAFYAKHIPKY